MVKTIATHTITLIIIAYIFALGCRMIYVNDISQVQDYKYNNEFMINTNDGYYFAEGARDLIKGSHENNDLSPVDTALSILTAFLVKVLPFSLETIIFYIPAFFGALIVIPLILIGQSLERDEVGFIGALIASIAWSYYNRTMVGYFDTDALNIVFPTFLIWSLILYFKTFEEKYLLFTGLEIIAYRWWYPSSYSLEVAFFIMVFIFALYLIYKKQTSDPDFTSTLKLMAMMLFAMVWLPEIVRIITVIGIYFIFKQPKLDKFIYFILAFAIIVFIATGGFNPIWFYLQSYIFKTTTSLDSNTTLQFYGVMQTIREAGAVPFSEFANRISGNIVLFLASLIGLALLTYQNKVLLLALPLLALGFAAFGIPGVIPPAGLRFTIYAVPIMALGSGYVIYLIAREIADIINKRRPNIVKNGLLIGLGFSFLFPHLLHIKEYNVPPVFSSSEVSQLSELGKIASREDYVVTWWDYGYPIRFYSDVKTLVDGGKHNGNDNYPASFCLTQNQTKAAKMARLAVEYTEKQENARLDAMMPIFRDYQLKDPNLLADSLELNDFKLPQKTRDIYFYLPYRMAEILPTIALFSNINLKTGKELTEQVFITAEPTKEENGTIFLSNGAKIQMTGAKLIINEQELPIKEFYTTVYNGKDLKVQKQQLNKDSTINVIYMKSYNQFLIVDDAMLNSVFVKLFILEDYDKNLFEQVLSSPYSKVYKLKI